MSKLIVHDIKGKQVDTIDLPKEVFEGKVKADVIHQAVVMYQAGQREGNAKIKQRNEVRGGGKKPFRQKGTGQARQGSSRSPLHSGGGKVHGPEPRDYSYTLPKKLRLLALRETLKAKFQDKTLICVEDVATSFQKTKEFVGMLKALNIKGKTVAAFDGSDVSLLRVSSNVPFFNMMRGQDLNAYDVLRHKNLLLSKTALNNLLDRVKS